jgi:hypothetical protein
MFWQCFVCDLPKLLVTEQVTHIYTSILSYNMPFYDTAIIMSVDMCLIGEYTKFGKENDQKSCFVCIMNAIFQNY